MTLNKIKITEHAYLRAKERLGLKKSSFERIVKTVLEKGLKHSDLKGDFRKYVTSLYFQYKTANNIRIYGEFVYLFNSNTLITIFEIPSNLKRQVKNFKKWKKIK